MLLILELTAIFGILLQEMMQHMVMKHGSQFDSYFEHITYPLTLYSGSCSSSSCSSSGKYLAYSQDLAKVTQTKNI
jgi:hypothetical protein